MENNILFISNIASKRIGSFSLASIRAAKKLNLNYHIAANFKNSTKKDLEEDSNKYKIKIHQVDFDRNPFSIQNVKSLYQIRRIIVDNKINIIHCNTPIGGLVGRIIGYFCKVETIIYQAHGFHFYKGGTLFNNLIIKNIERLLARVTDVIITINEEDYENSKQFKLRKNSKNYFKVNGVGINLENYDQKFSNRELILEQLGIDNNSYICISAGDLIKRKNYSCAIKAISSINDKSIHYLICGTGPEKDYLKKLSKDLGVENQIHFLGFRADVINLMKISDLFLFTSLQEGLARSVMEAMACGLPCVVSNIRGNNDLIKNGRNGFLFDSNNYHNAAKEIKKILYNKNLQRKIAENNLKDIKRYDIDKVVLQLENIYRYIKK